MDARKSLFVTGDVNIGRDPSNVNVWGNMTLTGIIDLTAGQDPDPALLLQHSSVVQLDGTVANGTVNVSAAAGGQQAQVTLRRALGEVNQTNATCVKSNLTLDNVRPASSPGFQQFVRGERPESETRLRTTHQI